jgi:hypothetical protein
VLNSAHSSATVAQAIASWIELSIPALLPNYPSEWTCGERAGVAAAEVALACYVVLDLWRLEIPGLKRARRSLALGCGSPLIDLLEADPGRWFRPALVINSTLDLPLLKDKLLSIFAAGLGDLAQLRIDQVLEMQFFLRKSNISNPPRDIIGRFVAAEWQRASNERLPGSDYVLTHLLFYETEFGVKECRVGDANLIMAEVFRRAAARGDVDLMAESAFAAACAGHPGLLAEAGLVVAQCQNKNGSINPCTTHLKSASTDVELVFHSSLVGLIATCALNKNLSEGDLTPG